MRKSLLAIVACAMFPQWSAGADYKITVVAENLDFPWSLAFLPNGELLVTERNGGLRMIRDGQVIDYSIAGVPEALVKGQGGLLDVLVDPDFATNELIYVAYAAGTPSSNALEVIRGRLDGSTLYDVTTILSVTPRKGTPHHYGGRMAFMPDGTLLITSGEGFDYREQAQQKDSLMGKVLRIHTDGSVPVDNPFVSYDDARDEIFTYGHRNPQGIAVASDGTVWMHEHGPKGGDELNRLVAGANYGWPAVSHGVNYTGEYVSPFTEAPGMEDPVVVWVPSIAPAGLAIYEGDAFPDWTGNLFVAALVEKSVRRLVLDSNGEVVEQDIMFTELDQRIRDVRVGPDGHLYLLSDSSPGTIYRIHPSE